MTSDPFVRKETNEDAGAKFCPIIKDKCKGNLCQWWTTDYMEDRQRYRMNCAVTIIALGVTDEALAKLQGGKR